jgi:hypothetical protein
MPHTQILNRGPAIFREHKDGARASPPPNSSYFCSTPFDFEVTGFGRVFVNPGLATTGPEL